ncbi:MAG: GDSL-type esterase/lipase family protein [Planctomycetota bacterium]
MADDSCDPPDAALAEPLPHRVACVGASVTFGLGLTNRRETCYPAVLQTLLDSRDGPGRWRVRNFGYSGATASRGGNEPYWRTPSFTAATRFRPQTTVVLLGTNDAQFANAASRETLAADLEALVGHFRSVDPASPGRVLLSDPPPAFPPVPEIDFDALVTVVRPTIRAVAERAGTPLIDYLTPLAGTGEAFPDGLHPTAEVAAQIAAITLAALTPAVEPTPPTEG